MGRIETRRCEAVSEPEQRSGHKPVLVKRPDDWDTYTDEQKLDYAKNMAKQMGIKFEAED